MNGLLQILFVPGAVKLGDDHGRSGREAYKHLHDKIHDLIHRSAYRRQSLFTHKTTDNNRVGRVIYLLKECSCNNRKEKKKQLFPDHAFCDLIFFTHH